MAKVSFKDFTPVNYMPGEDELINRQAKKRKMDTPTGNTAEAAEKASCGCGSDCGHCGGKHTMDEVGKKCGCCDNEIKAVNVDEALSMAQRRQKARTMKKYQARLKVGQKKARAKIASSKVLVKRSRKAARRAMAKKLTQGIAKRDLTPSRKKEIEARLDKMKGRVNRMAKKLLPTLRKAEMGKKRG